MHFIRISNFGHLMVGSNSLLHKFNTVSLWLFFQFLLRELLILLLKIQIFGKIWLELNLRMHLQVQFMKNNLEYHLLQIRYSQMVKLSHLSRQMPKRCNIYLHSSQLQQLYHSLLQYVLDYYSIFWVYLFLQGLEYLF